MVRHQKQQQGGNKKPYQCMSQREHFNYLRNNSCGIWSAFTWGDDQVKIQDEIIDLNNQRSGYYSQKNAENNYAGGEQRLNQQSKKNRRVSFDDNRNAYQKNTNTQGRGEQRRQSQSRNAAQNKGSTNRRAASSFNRKSKLEKDVEGERMKQEENRRKVSEYIEQQRPYSRGLTNTKFQDYFGKAAPQCYGRANTNEPIGGIIYGNHLKTFNMNPHLFTNHPQNYQTHTTAINYGKRTKLNQQQRWKKLERQLTKKLGLKEKNETIKQGKEVVYVDVDDSNMYQIMKENHEFQKANREQIHGKEVEYKKDKHQQYLDDINEFYAKKSQKIADNLSTQQSERAANTAGPGTGEDHEARLNQQVIYKYHDKHGNVRYAGDRHAITCFVDMNFPENAAAYTQELIDRMPIFPIKVEGENRNIDAIRRENYFKSKQQVYPSHYLIRNCEEPQVLKMLSEKTGIVLASKSAGKEPNKNKSRAQGNGNAKNSRKNANGSFGSTNAPGGSSTSKAYERNREKREYDSQYEQQENSTQRNKSQMMNRAWENAELANSIQQKLNQSCCAVEHLPHNEMNPRCYKNASAKIGRIPSAG